MDDFPHEPQPNPPAESTSSAERTDDARLPTRRVTEPAPTPTFRDRMDAARTRIPQRPSAQPRPRKPRKALIRTLEVALVVAIILVAAVIFLSIRLRRDMRAALPQLDGTVHAVGLHAPVTVTRDAQGVPSVTANSLDDLLFAQGYVTAGDRLFQMDALRRHAAGELAEILGGSLADHDRQQRTLQLQAAADNAVAAMSPDQRAQLEAYSRGVNAYIDSHRATLPVEFVFLHYTPAPWQPRDSMLVMLAMWQSLATTFPHKLAREALLQHIPSNLEHDLYPVGSFRDRPPTQPPNDLTTPVDEVDQIPLDSTQSSLEPDTLIQRELSLTLQSCTGCKAGSNNWAVAGARSASGAPLLSNDMHLGLTVPDIWYEAALHLHSSTAPIDVAGFTLPGVPFVLVGRNAHVAWGFTNLGADVQDIYIEHLRGSGSSLEFQHPDGSWSAAQHHTETIKVRFRKDITLDVVTTQHTVGAKQLTTPIISSLFPGEHRPLALAWTANDPSALPLPMLAFNSATSGAGLVAAAATFGGPSLNLVYADDNNHIGFHAIGFVPIRGAADHHPRPIAPLILPTDIPPDEQTDPNASPGASSEPEAQLASPHLILAGYTPQRHRRAAAPKPTPHPQTPKTPVAPQPETTDTTITPQPKLLDYTIGEPIPSVPVDALNATVAWSGYVPYDELPSTVDPPGGVLVTANSRISADDYPYALANEWIAPWRAERIHHLLDGRTNLTPADMLRVQLDIHSEFNRILAQRFAYAVDHASTDKLDDPKRLRVAADILRNWDGNMTTDSVAASIIAATEPRLIDTLVAAQIRAHDHLSAHDRRADELARFYLWGNSSTALELILNHQPARWLPAGQKDWNSFLAATLATSLHDAGAPRDLTRWTWGPNHRSAVQHPIFTASSHIARLLGVATNPKPTPLPGDTTTIDSLSPQFGPSERFTADLRSPDASTANIVTGQSGNPASPHYLDHFPAWSTGTTFTLPLAPTGAHTLTLLP